MIDIGPDRLMDVVPYLMCLCADDGRITFINSAGARMLGASADDFLGHWFTDYVESDYAAILGEEITGGDLTEIDIPLKLRSVKGQGIDVALTIRPNPAAGGCLIVGMDITERILSAGQLRAARDELQVLVDQRTQALEQESGERKKAEGDRYVAAQLIANLAEAVVVMGADKHVLWVNEAYHGITGYDQDDVVGELPPFDAVLREDADEYERIWATVAEKGNWQGEYWNARKDGERYAERLSITAIEGEDGNVQCYGAIINDITQRKLDEERILYQANYDQLTGLPNRTLFLDRLTQSIATTRRARKKLGLMFIDLDGFKLINDTLGHDMGDLLLKEASNRLQECVRSGDTVARLGGDEFTVIMPNLDESQMAEIVAGRILRALATPFDLDGKEAFVSGSMGITIFPDDADGVNELVKNADSAMYLAKEKGKAGYQFYTEELNAQVTERVALKNGLAMALERDEFKLFYQPKMDIATGEITSAEALMRWSHGDLGNVSPARFIPILEETGQVVEVGEWALREALRQHAVWVKRGLPSIRVAVNLSARQLREISFVSLFEKVLSDADVGPECLEVEITESMMMSDTANAIKAVQALHDMGIHVAMDDFGTGYSSLSYLKKFPIDTIKIDQSFVADIATDKDDAEIIRAIITMGKTLNRQIVAEGVETEEQLSILADYDCNIMQGYLLSKPLPGDDFLKFMSDRAKP